MKPLSKKIFFPSEDWIYFKIYCNSGDLDLLLIKKISPIIKKLKKENLINKWFFIRYTDEFGFHLRIRFECNNQYLKVIELFLKKLKNRDGFETEIKKIQIDTYEKETERYGTDTIHDVENFFCRDSELIIREISKRITDTNRRWLFAISLITHYLRGLNYSYSTMVELMEHFSLPYYKRFNPSKTTFSQINGFYNANKQQILDSCRNPFEILDINTEDFESDLLELKKVLSNGHFVAFEELLADLIHMSLNRIFQDNQNRNEYIIYEFLKKAYKALHITEKNIRENNTST